ncbi:MAG: flagellar motor switch phosphatase FliY [Bacillota bacterium]|uniref:Flagellar motor switch phosphatase FliY n=1 Tax=Virgibacillus salarius TaxID=447199 RepID=A0A941DQ28_9BACI|nr:MULTISPECIES: flagellar motor switch phosphatase FliY [Bacillaceae]NAZ07579.1 flagellar motor switch phosphatase FliY [Agaribacter marinus]MBR7794859.1 flagellar motor switch phosphatase FliY [Virgibacillus salarius]MCC2249272.1 flagellar motor switch phosphatase FliY [Virgibacillus sp. AGTR]MDY7043902.1 flagellar motor switch phosphatase FliY [Virgibacillus sp. M23]QRZ17308.1 flagellar motor switch phosphatase FliY [Virgibacillus sp. AGTR]
MANDGMLSQDEIDALLKVSSDEDEEVEKNPTNDHLSTIEEDTLGEIGNISFGSSATTLSTLLNQKVEITTPKVSVMEQKELEAFTFEPVSVQVNYIEGFTGRNVFVIKAEDAAIISDIMLGGDGTKPSEELNEIHLSAVQEAMNQMMGAAATSMSTVFNKKVDISPPTIHLENPDNQSEAVLDENPFVKVSFQLKVGNLIDSNIMQLMPIQFAKNLVDQLLNSEPAEQESAVALEQVEVPMSTNKQSQSVSSEEVREEPQYLGNAVSAHKSVQKADFSNFDQVALNNTEQRNLDMLLDIPLKVTVELGRTKRTIKDILDLSSGSIIELDKLAGEPVDILVNEKLIATGEVVVIDENFGVRVTDILSQSDRIMKLK